MRERNSREEVARPRLRFAVAGGMLLGELQDFARPTRLPGAEQQFRDTGENAQSQRHKIDLHRHLQRLGEVAAGLTVSPIAQAAIPKPWSVLA